MNTASPKFFVKHVGNMGDHVFLVPPILETLKRVHPNCHITLLTAWGYKHKEIWGERNQSGFCIHLMMTNPHVDELIHFHSIKTSLNKKICYEDGKWFPTWSKQYYTEQARSGAYDGVFELDIGLSYEENPMGKMYQIVGLPNERFSNYKLYFTDKDKAVAHDVMKDVPRPRIVLLEGLEGTTTRGWDPGKIPALEKAIERKYGVPPLWFGGKHTPEFQGRPLTLRENIATLLHCDAAVGVLSGPLHFGAAVGLPTITMYGGLSLQRTAPAYFLNQYLKNHKKYHRTILSPDQLPYQNLKSNRPDRNLTPAERKTQQFIDWQNPGRQSTKSGLAAIAVDEIMLVLSDTL